MRLVHSQKGWVREGEVEGQTRSAFGVGMT